MLERINKISSKIKLQLNNKNYIDDLKKHMKKSDEWVERYYTYDSKLTDKTLSQEYYSKETLENPDKIIHLIFPYYLRLLGIACTYNLAKELDELLIESNHFKINLQHYNSSENHAFLLRPFVDRPLLISQGDDGFPDTLLGIASFHGHFNLARYLIEQKKADVNATNIYYETPLHKAVLGDSYPQHHHSYGTEHAEITQYLLQCKADITITNNKGCTPLEAALRSEPPFFLFSNPIRKEYFADKVRPILQTHQKALSSSESNTSSFESERLRLS